MKKTLNSKKINAFDFLRLLAALTVVIQHSVEHLQLSFFWFSAEKGWWFSDGVPMFFILSGLLVFKSCENALAHDKPISHYFLNRFLRIAPGIYFYLLITLFSLIIFNVLTPNDLKTLGLVGWITSTLLLIPIYHPQIFSDFGVGVVNGSLWTIPAEFSFYIVLPLFVIILRKSNFKTMMILLTSLSIISLFISESLSYNETIWVKLFNITFIPYMIYFAIGIFWSKAWQHAPKQGFIALLTTIVYVILRYEVFIDKEFFGYLYDLLWAVPLSYSLVWFGYKAPIVFYKVTSKIGDLSFGIYIWHMVIVNYFIYFNVPDKLSNFSHTVVNLAVLLITSVFAYISWNFVEKQALKLKPYSSKDSHLNINSDVKKAL